MERNCDSLAVILWKNAYPDIDHETVIEDLLVDRLGKHLRNVPHLDERELHYDAEYSYKRAETVLDLIRKTHTQKEQTAVLGSKIINTLKENEEKS